MEPQHQSHCDNYQYLVNESKSNVFYDFIWSSGVCYNNLSKQIILLFRLTEDSPQKVLHVHTWVIRVLGRGPTILTIPPMSFSYLAKWKWPSRCSLLVTESKCEELRSSTTYIFTYDGIAKGKAPGKCANTVKFKVKHEYLENVIFIVFQRDGLIKSKRNIYQHV